jgi:hypothetical protein
MTERKLKRILHDKPYLMDGLFVRSRDEAQQMALASTLTINQVLQSIRQDPEISAATWARDDLALKAKQHRDSKQTTHKERTHDWGSNIRTRRRIVAVAAAMILVVAFFTLIPRGRALAKDVFDYFMNVFGNHIKFESTDQTSSNPITVADNEKKLEEEVNEFGDVIIHYENLDDFAEEYGLATIRLVSEKFNCTQITLTIYEASGISLTSVYTSTEGSIVITQKWLMSDNLSVHSNSDGWESIEILGNIKLLYAIDKVDGVFDGFTTVDDSILWITAESGVDILRELANLG